MKTVEETRKMIDEAVNKIREEAPGFEPSAGIILGTGLGALANEIKPLKKIPYGEIPHFPVSTVESHSGILIAGEMQGKKVLAMSGRFHRYEGYSMKQIAFPVYVMKKLGVKNLFISNAAGGMNPAFKAGDLAVITDHINFMGDNPLLGPNDPELGPRWPDMIEPYSSALIKAAFDAGKELGIELQKGVYMGVTGPNLETRAEYRMMGKFADMVGMSTVPEVIAGVHAGMRILGISVITDECVPETLKPVNIEHILQNAAKAEPKLTAIMKAVIGRVDN